MRIPIINNKYYIHFVAVERWGQPRRGINVRRRRGATRVLSNELSAYDYHRKKKTKKSNRERCLGLSMPDTVMEEGGGLGVILIESETRIVSGGLRVCSDRRLNCALLVVIPLDEVDLN